MTDDAGTTDVAPERVCRWVLDEFDAAGNLTSASEGEATIGGRDPLLSIERAHAAALAAAADVALRHTPWSERTAHWRVALVTGYGIVAEICVDGDSGQALTDLHPHTPA